MRKINMKIIAIILVVGSMLIFGVGRFKTTDTYSKYKLVTIAKAKGATIVDIADDSVTYVLGNSHMTVYSFDYGIRELSGK